jgi:hypothetical protein
MFIGAKHEAHVMLTNRVPIKIEEFPEWLLQKDSRFTETADWLVTVYSSSLPIQEQWNCSTFPLLLGKFQAGRCL